MKDKKQNSNIVLRAPKKVECSKRPPAAKSKDLSLILALAPADALSGTVNKFLVK